MRWSPTQPTSGGRLCPRVAMPAGCPADYSSKLELYYLERQDCCSLFTRRMNSSWLRNQRLTHLFVDSKGPFIEDVPGPVLFKYLLYGIGQTMSLNFQRKLSSLCNAGKINAIKRWYQTVDGLVLPLLLTAENPDEHYPEIDSLIKFGFENCANNYSHFISRMKSLKRILRKDYATNASSAMSMTDVSTYRRIFLKFCKFDGDPHQTVQTLLIWTQTRASGLADTRMVNQSLDKCEITLSTPRRPPSYLNSTRVIRSIQDVLDPPLEPKVPNEQLTRIGIRVRASLRGETAHVSAGPNACIESTRQSGGQTGYISCLARIPCLHSTYDFRTLEPTRLPTVRPIRSSTDLVSWAIQETLHHPTYVRCARLHAVAEPSKARTITVGSLPYQILAGVMAKLLQPSIASHITRTGLHASRNLWKFLYEDLDPTADLWYTIRDQFKTEIRSGANYPILGLTSDLSEATDYGDLGVARQILTRILEAVKEIPGFPLGMANLAKTLFIGKRFCFRNYGGNYRYFVKVNGWLMGDRLTKVILTLAHEIAVQASGLHAARICGDDVVAFSRSRSDLERYHQVVTEMGFKISEEDHYISSRLAFYCEEACIPPQTYMGLPPVAVRRKNRSVYIDYPRIRLLIPTCVENHAHSYTDIGRFSLLGKESRWVHQNGDPVTQALYVRAGLLQHLMVPRTADTICPYIPMSIGGDDGFPHTGDFLEKVVLRKSRNLTEVKYRMDAILSGKWGYRLVRNANLDNVVHRYHTLVPKIKELKEIIPPGAIIEGNQFLLNSIKIGGVETPERTFFRIWRAWYWHEILQGRKPPELSLEVQRGISVPHTDVMVDYHYFLSIWRDLGFTYENVPDYLVETSQVHILDYMNLGEWYGLPTIPHHLDLNDLGGRFIFNEENLESFINHIKDNRELSPIVRSTVHRYVESDSYIKWEFSRRDDLDRLPGLIFLVSSDFKLGAELARMARAKSPDKISCPTVVVIPCRYYSYGMMDTFYDWAKSQSIDPITIVDQGSVNYDQMVNSPEFSYYDKPIVTFHHYRNNVWLRTIIADLEETGTTPRERWSLTTQHPSQWRPGYYPVVPLRT